MLECSGSESAVPGQMRKFIEHSGRESVRKSSHISWVLWMIYQRRSTVLAHPQT